MIKIPLFYNKENLRVPAVLKLPHKRIASDFVFDTGSPHTILNYTDSIRLGIPHTGKGELIRIGGRTYQSFIFNKLEIVFKSEDSKPISIILPIRVLKPNSPRVDELEKLDAFPNLLGLDFLEMNYRFFCDIQNNKILFEKD